MTTWRLGMAIIYVKTKLGTDLPDLGPAYTYDGGFDVRAAARVIAWPYRRTLVSLGFVYRFVDEDPIVRNGIEYIQTLEVVKKGSGEEWLEPLAIIFDKGYHHDLNDPKGCSLVVVNRSPIPRIIRRGRKIAQLVEREVRRVDIRLSTVEELQKIRRPDDRGAARLGSSGG